MKVAFSVHCKDELGKCLNNETILIDDEWFCPVCNQGLHPNLIDGLQIIPIDFGEYREVFLIMRCPCCSESYVLKYRQDCEYDWLKQGEMPSYPCIDDLPQEISELSPKFSELYKQCLFAQKDPSIKGLTGMGLRKALEFLIKDYLIKMKHQDEQTIIKMNLIDCVNKLSGAIETLARASTWIGNDETHYFRKNPEYDIDDLMDFIDAFIANIQYELIEQKAKRLISK